MSKMTLLRAALGGLVSLLAAASAPAAGWVLTDLGTLGGASSAANGLNNAGQVVGLAEAADGTPYPAIWNAGVVLQLSSRPGRAIAVSASGTVAGNVASLDGTRLDATLMSAGNAIDLGTFGGSFSTVAGVNDSGQVIGFARTPDEKEHAFLATASGMLDLGTYGGLYSYAYAINQGGLVVGSAYDTAGKARCFLSSGGGLVDPGTLGGSFCNAFAVNDAGQVTGSSATAAGIGHAFLRGPQGMVDLGTLGGSSSLGKAINRHGHVVGSARTAANQTHAFIHDGTQMIDMGTLGGTSSVATAVNALGQAVGNSTLASGAKQPFFYANGTMVNLNAVVPGLSNINPDNVYLNDAGQIAGTGSIGGQQHAFVLTPAP